MTSPWWYSYPQYFDWNTGMMFGAVLVVSDPVKTLAGIKELGVDPSQSTGSASRASSTVVLLFVSSSFSRQCSNTSPSKLEVSSSSPL